MIGTLAGAVAARAQGVAAALMVAAAASFVSALHGGPQMVYALFFGVSMHFLAHEPRTRPGIDFCARSVLRLGVALLGLRITLAQIAALGWVTAAVVVVAVASTIALGVALGRRLGFSRGQGVLCGGAVAICGASAALAISAVLPRERHGERFTLVVVVAVTLMSTAAMVLYPLGARALDLPPALAGLFLGGSIHDVAQVVGAGYGLGAATGDAATLVKLMRVAMLAAVVAVVSAAFRVQREAAEDAGPRRREPLLPGFLWAFVGLVALGSSGWVPQPLLDAASLASRGCLVVAIAALGMRTSFAQLAREGWRPVLLIAAETLWIAGFVLAAACWLR